MIAIGRNPPCENVSTEPPIAPPFPFSGAGLVRASELTLEVRPNGSGNPSIGQIQASTMLELQ